MIDKKELKEAIIELWDEFESTEDIAEALNIAQRTVRHYILKMKREDGIVLPGYSYKNREVEEITEEKCADSAIEVEYSTKKDYLNSYPKQIGIEVTNGYVVVFSDAHYNPSLPITVAHKALVAVCKELKPKVVVANGDIVDLAQVSTHGRIGYSKVYSVKDELDFARDRLQEVKEACDRATQFIYTIGNHDVLRYDTFLAKHAGQFAGLKGFKFQDQIDWPVCLEIVVNKDISAIPTLIKHRMGSSSLHSNYINAQKSLINTVNGHNHKLRVSSITDYFGKARYGVETGTLSDIHGNQFFDYCEGGQSQNNWESGFVVLQYDGKGNLLPPELITVLDGRAFWRGKFLDV
jgi:predicted phosphodiesterase